MPLLDGFTLDDRNRDVMLQAFCMHIKHKIQPAYNRARYTSCMTTCGYLPRLEKRVVAYASIGIVLTFFLYGVAEFFVFESCGRQFSHEMPSSGNVGVAQNQTNQETVSDCRMMLGNVVFVLFLIVEVALFSFLYKPLVRLFDACRDVPQLERQFIAEGIDDLSDVMHIVGLQRSDIFTIEDIKKLLDKLESIVSTVSESTPLVDHVDTQIIYDRLRSRLQTRSLPDAVVQIR